MKPMDRIELLEAATKLVEFGDKLQAGEYPDMGEELHLLAGDIVRMLKGNEPLIKATMKVVTTLTTETEAARELIAIQKEQIVLLGTMCRMLIASTKAHYQIFTPFSPLPSGLEEADQVLRKIFGGT